MGNNCGKVDTKEELDYEIDNEGKGRRNKSVVLHKKIKKVTVKVNSQNVKLNKSYDDFEDIGDESSLPHKVILIFLISLGKNNEFFQKHSRFLEQKVL